MALNLAQLDRLISITEAARIFGLSEDRLRDLISEGRIRAAILPDGEIGVSSKANLSALDVLNSRLQEISRKQFSHLDDSWITIAEAQIKYSIPNRTIRTWLKHRYIRLNESKFPSEVNDADTAYCVAIYNVRKNNGLVSGAPLLENDGTPYLLKHPSLSIYRRKKKTQTT